MTSYKWQTTESRFTLLVKTKHLKFRLKELHLRYKVLCNHIQNVVCHQWVCDTILSTIQQLCFRKTLPDRVLLKHKPTTLHPFSLSSNEISTLQKFRTPHQNHI